MAAPVGQGASPVVKVALADQQRAQVFDPDKAEGCEIGVERVGFKMDLERLAQGCDPRGKCLLGGVVVVLVGIRGLGIAVAPVLGGRRDGQPPRGPCGLAVLAACVPCGLTYFANALLPSAFSRMYRIVSKMVSVASRGVKPSSRLALALSKYQK